METAPIISATKGLFAVSILGVAAGTAIKSFPKTKMNSIKPFNSKKATGNLLKGGVGILVGTSLLKAM